MWLLANSRTLQYGKNDVFRSENPNWITLGLHRIENYDRLHRGKYSKPTTLQSGPKGGKKGLSESPRPPQAEDLADVRGRRISL
jgi:hypothetical protein